jgi:hypothetical protein
MLFRSLYQDWIFPQPVRSEVPFTLAKFWGNRRVSGWLWAEPVGRSVPSDFPEKYVGPRLKVPYLSPHAEGWPSARTLSVEHQGGLDRAGRLVEPYRGHGPRFGGGKAPWLTFQTQEMADLIALLQGIRRAQ